MYFIALVNAEFYAEKDIQKSLKLKAPFFEKMLTENFLKIF
jgi:hypothetical protein